MEGFTGYFTGPSAERQYLYDTNGGLKEDKNKGAVYSYSPYNGMPLQVSVNNVNTKGLNTYQYTATGVKLSKRQYHDPNNVLQPVSGTGEFVESDFANCPVKETRYEYNLEFENGSLKRILIENGYIENNRYYFYVKDHLGNNRVVADQNGQAVQHTDYYPFGMPHPNSTAENVQPYKFGGKEYDQMHGLDTYDFEARNLGTGVPVFDRLDPLAEKKPWMSPYVYCSNNPMKYIDPDGRKLITANSTTSALNNLARIAATNVGQIILNRLISSPVEYETNTEFLTINCGYDYNQNIIYYVENTWWSTVDGGYASNEILMGHELYHAYQDNTNQVQMYKGVIKNLTYLERVAVSFENYLRRVYGVTPSRDYYSKLAGGQKSEFFPYLIPTQGESISNFTPIKNNKEKTQFGFRFEIKKMIIRNDTAIGYVSLQDFTGSCRLCGTHIRWWYHCPYFRYDGELILIK
jgi:RHS repeat-associated protein